MKQRIFMMLMVLVLAACGKSDTTTPDSTTNQNPTEQGVQLRINLKPGDTWTYDQQQTMMQTMEAMGQSQTILMTTTTQLDSTVLEPAADGNARYTTLFQSMVVTQTLNGETVVTDASDPQGLAASGNGQALLVGKTLTTTIAPSGEIKDLEGIEELMGNSTNDPAMQQMISTFGTQLKDTLTKGPGVTTYPDNSLNVGDTWTQSIEMPVMFMRSSIAMTYTVESISDGSMELSIKGNGSLSADKEALKQMAGASGQQIDDMEMLIDIAITMDGTMDIDTTTGLLNKQHINQQLKGTMSMGKTGEELMEIPMDMIQTMDTTRR